MSGWLDGTPFEVIPGATAAALLAGALLPPLGLWIVMQRVVFLGVTLSQVAAAGVALGLLLHVPALPLGLLLCALLVAGLARRATGGVGSGGDSALGAAFCLASALALLFISRSPADLDQVSHILHGNLIFASGADVQRMGAALLGGTLLVLLGFSRILFCAFDGETAAALGLPVRRWLLLLFSVLAVVLTLSMRTTGALLTFALLILPSLAALQLGRGLRATFWLSAALGAAGAAAGLWLAVRADLHLESSIVVACFALVPLAALARRSTLGALAVAAVLLAAVPLAAPARDAVPGAGHAGHAAHDGHVEADAHPSFGVDVHLAARRDAAAPDGARIAWTLSARGVDANALPPALWLLLTGEGVLAEVPLVPDTAALRSGPPDASGEFLVEDLQGATRLSGQLWSGPSDALDALPVDDAVVVGCRTP